MQIPSTLNVIDNYQPLDKPPVIPSPSLESKSQEKRDSPIAKTLFSAKTRKRVALVDFFNCYIVNSTIIGSLLTSYDLVKIMRKFYLWCRTSQSETVNTEEIEWVIKELNESLICTDSNLSQQRLWNNKERILNTLDKAGTQYLKTGNIELHQRFQKWYQTVKEIINQPLLIEDTKNRHELMSHLKQLMDQKSLSQDWELIEVDPQGPPEINLREIWQPKPSLFQRIKRWIPKPSWLQRGLRYSYLTGILLGLNPDVLIVMAVIEGIVLINQLRKKTK